MGNGLRVMAWLRVAAMGVCAGTLLLTVATWKGPGGAAAPQGCGYASNDEGRTWS